MIAYAIDAEALQSEYVSNEAAGDEKYKGKVIDVKGNIIAIGTELAGRSIPRSLVVGKHEQLVRSLHVREKESGPVYVTFGSTIGSSSAASVPAALTRLFNFGNVISRRNSSPNSRIQVDQGVGGTFGHRRLLIPPHPPAAPPQSPPRTRSAPAADSA